MNRIFYSILMTGAFALLCGGCLDETFPEGAGVLGKQVEGSEESMVSLNNAIPNNLITYGSGEYSAIGYPDVMLCGDIMVGNLPIAATDYDYFYSISTGLYLSAFYSVSWNWWTYYTSTIRAANLVLNAAPAVDEANATERECMGNALTYRAFCYLDMVRLYEFKKTNTGLDNNYTKLAGLTVPLVTEKTTEQEARNNPRQPFYVMYRFIMNDLDRAEFCLQGVHPASRNKASQAVVFGLKARLWLEMGSRFDLNPDDLATMKEHENDADLAAYAKLDVNSANDCFQRAAEYARMAIAEGYTPLTEDQW